MSRGRPLAHLTPRKEPEAPTAPAPLFLRFAGLGAVQLAPGARPIPVQVSGVPVGPPGCVAFVPSVQAATDVGVHVHAVERDREGAAVAAVSAIGSRPAVLSPGDVLASLV